MAQLFSPRANVYSKLIIVAFLIMACGGGWAASTIYWSPYTTNVNVPLDQPIPFSHKHHVTDDGIDCRYCHDSVEKSAFAGMPSTETCLSCHSQLWNDAPILAPVRASLSTKRPIKWARVNDLPDYVYFNHSIHVAKGIGCSTCHGRIDQMPITRKTETLYMKWCLECHRAPGKFLRPRDQIYEMAWNAADEGGARRGDDLVQQYHIDTSGRLTDCSVCHR
jgi:hypothetical protein